MYCIRLWHAPKCRFNFPINWQVVDPLQLAAVDRQGQYWFDHLQLRKDVTKIILTNLKTNEVQEYNQPVVHRNWWGQRW